MISELFRNSAQRHRDELAIVDRNQRITYGELLERVNAMRAWLRDALDPKAGDVIAVSQTNTWEFVASFFAIAELGAVFMPCNPQWRASELGWFAKRLGFRGVIAEPQFRAEWDRMGDVIRPESVLTVSQPASRLEPDEATNPLPSLTRSEADPVIYLPTSGSTGTPRLVPRTHRNLETLARNLASALGTGSGSRFLSMVPFFHSNGFHNCMLMPVLSGATLVLMKQFSAAACAELVHRERVEVLTGSPFVFNILAESGVDPGMLSTLRLCFSGGARMPSAVPERWRDRFGVRVRQ